MIRGHGWFQSGEHKNLPVLADLENGAAAIADIQVSLAVERDAGGHTHPLDEGRHVPCRGDLIDETLVAAGNVQQPVTVKGQPGGVHQIIDERLHIEVQIETIDSYGDLLAARAAEG